MPNETWFFLLSLTWLLTLCVEFFVDLGANLKSLSTDSQMLSISVARSGRTLLLLTNKVGEEARLAKLTFTRGVLGTVFVASSFNCLAFLCTHTSSLSSYLPPLSSMTNDTS